MHLVTFAIENQFILLKKSIPKDLRYFQKEYLQEGIDSLLVTLLTFYRSRHAFLWTNSILRMLIVMEVIKNVINWCIIGPVTLNIILTQNRASFAENLADLISEKKLNIFVLTKRGSILFKKDSGCHSPFNELFFLVYSYVDRTKNVSLILLTVS